MFVIINESHVSPYNFVKRLMSSSKEIEPAIGSGAPSINFIQISQYESTVVYARLQRYRTSARWVGTLWRIASAHLAGMTG